MKKLTLAAALILLSLALSSVSTEAGTISIPKAKPAAKVTVPDSWAPEETESGIGIESPDQVATVYLEITSKKGADALIDENIDWLIKEQGVKIDAATKKELDVEIGGREFSRISWDGTSKEYGPAVIGFLFTELSNGKILTVTYWITKKDADKHFETLEKIFASIKEIE